MLSVLTYSVILFLHLFNPLVIKGGKGSGIRPVSVENLLEVKLLPKLSESVCFKMALNEILEQVLVLYFAEL